MIIIISVIIGLTAYFANKFIRKYFLLILGIFFAISVVPIFWYVPILEQLVVSGYLGFAFYVIVMIAGGFKKFSTISKRFRSVRKEYSIFGFVLLIPHFYVYLVAYLNGTLSWEFYGVIAMVIMIPLFITSFTKIKSKMNIKSWKKLQNFAYLIYVLIFVHLLVSGTGEHTLEYIIIFSFYFFLKFVNYIILNKITLVKITKVVYTGAILSFSILWVLSNGIISLGDTQVPDDSQGLASTEEVVAINENSGPISLSDGEYVGVSTGYKDLPVEVLVTLEDGYITEIEIIKYGATAPDRGIDFEQAALYVVSQMMSEQSTLVDSVAGATHTTEGIIDAVYDALH